jgi:hypothetical protein
LLLLIGLFFSLYFITFKEQSTRGCVRRPGKGGEM